MDYATSTTWTSDGLPKDVKGQLCVIQAGQTGDASHVAAAAGLDDNTDILVISPEKKDETSELVKYFEYVTSFAKGVPERERVRFIALESTSQDKKVRCKALYNLMVDDPSDKRVDLKKVLKTLVDFLDTVRRFSILQYPPFGANHIVSVRNR